MVELKRIAQIVSILLIIGCSPQKRLNRLITKYPHLTVTHTDTMKVFDTIYLDSFDTLVRSEIIYSDSTIIVNNERVFAKYFYDTLRQEIIHEIKCKGDTVFYYKEIPFEVEKVVFKELSWWQKYRTIIYIILGLLTALFILKKFREYLPF